MRILLESSQDWLQGFLPAIDALLNGTTPYAVLHFWNPPWALFPLLPFALFPLGRVLLLAVSIAALALVAHRLGATPLSMLAFLLSPLVFDALLWANIEWLTLLGLIVNPIIGMFALVLKPQMTIVPAALLLFRSWRTHGWKGIAVPALPVACALALSFVIYGLWPLKILSYGSVAGNSVSFFPYSVPLGFVLSWFAFRKDDLRYALVATPMFFPTLSPQVWLVAPLALVRSTRWSMVVLIASWAFVAWVNLAL